MLFTHLSSAVTLSRLQITFKRALSDFFANVTWSDKYNVVLTVDEQHIIERWDNPNIWVSLIVHMIFVVSYSVYLFIYV